MNSLMSKSRHTCANASSSASEYTVPYSVGCEMYTAPGATMCSRFSSPQYASHSALTSSASSLPSCWGSGSVLRPHASTAPASCAVMWPVVADTMPSQGRRIWSATAALACVPPTRKYTFACGHAHASRMRSRAAAHTSSVP